MKERRLQRGSFWPRGLGSGARGSPQAGFFSHAEARRARREEVNHKDHREHREALINGFLRQGFFCIFCVLCG
jgi:hypothetical protein